MKETFEDKRYRKDGGTSLVLNCMKRFRSSLQGISNTYTQTYAAFGSGSSILLIAFSHSGWKHASERTKQTFKSQNAHLRHLPFGPLFRDKINVVTRNMISESCTPHFSFPIWENCLLYQANATGTNQM